MVKVRQQTAGAALANFNAAPIPASFHGTKVEPCPGGCGTMVLNNMNSMNGGSAADRLLTGSTQLRAAC